jgi:N-acetyl sugar amidotransferase
MGENRICTRCIMDTTVPGIAFDKNGECDYCKLHDRFEKKYPLNLEGRKKRDQIINEIKKSGRKKKYDCIVGFSGGRDSSYCLLMAKKLGLRPLAVHFNSGWNTDIAINNMKRIVKQLDVELRIIPCDNDELKELQIAFLKASVPDIDAPIDLAIITTLYRVAAEEDIHYIINGHSFRTEGNTPVGWSYMDGRYIKSVHKKFGGMKLKNFKVLNIIDLLYYIFIKKVKVVYFPEYFEYDRDDVSKMLKNELNWEYAGGHHFENKYMHFVTYFLREKFGIDKRKVEYSAMIRSGQMSREKALERIKENTSPESDEFTKYCITRLGISDEEFKQIMKDKPNSFLDYKTYFDILQIFRFPVQIACKMGILPMSLYEKYIKLAKTLRKK